LDLDNFPDGITPRDLGFGNPFVLSCFRDPKAPTTNIAINTSADTNGQIGPFQISSADDAKLQSEINELGARISELTNLNDAIQKMQMPQIGLIPCTAQVHVPGGSHQLDVSFNAAQCQNVRPIAGWVYTASLIATDICGGFTEYRISPDPNNATIQFKGNFCEGLSSVTVHWIGFAQGPF
jgi:hypothetical protein